MAEPLADGDKIDARFEQCYSGAVPDRVRVEPLVLEGRRRIASPGLHNGAAGIAPRSASGPIHERS